MCRSIVERAGLVAVIAVLAACTGAPKPVQTTERALTSAETGRLAPQQLSPGKCGLFLFSADRARRFVFFAQAQAGDAKVILTEGETSARLVAQNGDLFGQFMTELTYQVKGGAMLKVKLVPGESLEDGQRADAQMFVTDASGWETIVPLAGLTSCTPLAEN